jgi:hypothetical protein
LTKITSVFCAPIALGAGAGEAFWMLAFGLDELPL